LRFAILRFAILDSSGSPDLKAIPFRFHSVWLGQPTRL